MGSCLDRCYSGRGLDETIGDLYVKGSLSVILMQIVLTCRNVWSKRCLFDFEFMVGLYMTAARKN